jgi:hypothetical protein
MIKKWSTKGTTDALELSIVPAVLASSCCLTIPSLALIGFSFGETSQLFDPWIMRVAGTCILVASLLIYFYMKGIRNMQQIRDSQKIIIAVSAQTLFFAILIYIISLTIITPLLCSITGLNTCTL